MKLKRYFPFILFILLSIGAYGQQSENSSGKQDLTDYVDLFIGTTGPAHTYVGATSPMGLVQLGPNTGNFTWDYHSGYQYQDSTLRGFAHTHTSGGANPLLGELLILPFKNSEVLTKESIPFSKKSEKASPGYYTATLHEDDIKVELSTTARTGFHKYTFLKDDDYHVLINIDEVLYNRGRQREPVVEARFTHMDSLSLHGYIRNNYEMLDRLVYFAIEFSRPFQKMEFVDKKDRELVVDFEEMKKGETIELKVGISSVSVEGALKNLKTEVEDKSFERVRKEAEQEWNAILSKIKIQGSEQQKQLFYTNLYHQFIHPNNIADVDGKYRGADGKIHTMESGELYSTFAFWDIYRASFPLYTILIPEKIESFVNSILRHSDETGFLPVWALWGRDRQQMIGNHAVPVLVEAYLKGLYPDGGRAYESIKRTLTEYYWPKYKWALYDGYGYLPADKVMSESASRTLEANFDDWAAAQLAKELGKQDDYDFFMNRSQFYKNLYDPEYKLMRGKTTDGQWVEPFNPLNIEHAGTSNGDYTEANAWQYVWHVQHDIPGLIGLMGGKKEFETRLDSLLAMEPTIVGEGSTKDVSGLIGQYVHGNEPSHHIPYLYNYAGKPHKTQALVDQILNTMYDTTTNGYSGNNDFGQMSGWFILSSLGFYPVNPVSSTFEIGRPSYKEATIQVGDKSFSVKANNYGEDNFYVRSVKLNGKIIEDFKISYEEIMKGGELIFEMSDEPNETT
ncbi:MAG: GH92 family glycosyl hydrolase [Pricia sp.]